MAKRISIINFKGGVGKTTLALHLATGISSLYDKRVLLVDVDHQSTLSLVCLEAKKWEKLVDENKTIDAIFRHFTESNVRLPGREIVCKSPYGGRYPKLDLVPATLRLDETELDLTSTTKGNAIESEWDKRMLLCKWMEENGINDDYDYIIFDAPPATKLVTQNAIAVSHGYVVPVIPETVSIRGVPHLIERVFKKIDKKLSGLAEFLEAKSMQLCASYVPKTKLAGIVIFRIKVSGMAYSGYTNEHTTNLNSLKRDFKKEIVKPYIEDGVGVSECLFEGRPVYDLPDLPNVRNRGFVATFEKITDNVKKRIDSL